MAVVEEVVEDGEVVVNAVLALPLRSLDLEDSRLRYWPVPGLAKCRAVVDVSSSCLLHASFTEAVMQSAVGTPTNCGLTQRVVGDEEYLVQQAGGCAARVSDVRHKAGLGSSGVVDLAQHVALE